MGSSGLRFPPQKSRLRPSACWRCSAPMAAGRQLPTMSADAYATGQALHALNAAGISPHSEAYQKGAAYLLRTQLDDGTWLVRSRGFGFQPYFETGFPHGRDQFISAAATSWAVMALAAAIGVNWVRWSSS